MFLSDLDLERAKSALLACPIGHTIQYHPTVESTMPLAHQACQPTVPSGLVILTDQQSQGRGRLNRSWETPPGQALLMSVVLGTDLLPDQIPQLSILTAVAVRQAIIGASPGLADQILFKWPNDVLGGKNMHQSSRGQKVAGILTETAFMGSAIHYAVLGIGINVNQAQDELPQSVGQGISPVSLCMLAGEPLDRTALLIELCRALGKLCTQPETDYTKMWRKHLHTLGRTVAVTEVAFERPELDNTGFDNTGFDNTGFDNTGAIEDPEIRDGRVGSRPFTGTAVDVTQDGHLVVENAQGERRTFSSGEVTLRSSPNG